MSKGRLILILSIVGFLGIVTGGAGAFYVARKMQDHFEVSSAAAGIATSTSALESLRIGDNEKAAATLESALDGHALSLALFLEHESRSDVSLVLGKARAYRSAHPRSSGNPDVDAAVKAALTRDGKK
ncbi:MAG: hypothetical protein ACK4F6_18925 [Hylemonella sp.]